MVPLVKAVQELSKENKELKDELAEIKAQITGNKNSTSLSLSSAYLEQSAPNPSNGNAVIRYHVPTSVSSAKLVISDVKGSVIKQVTLNNRPNIAKPSTLEEIIFIQ